MWRAAVNFVWLSKRVSHLTASTSCHVKRKKKTTPNSFLRFLTLPQECRSRNEDVPHVTRGASSTAAQGLKALLPLWDETKSNVDARRRAHLGGSTALLQLPALPRM